MKSIPLTVVILHHGEADEIFTRLEEVSGAAQILVLEDPSEYSLGTAKKLVSAKNIQFVEHALERDFASHRNSIFPYITQEWILFLDRDESVSPKLWQEITGVIQQTEFDAYKIPREDVFLGQTMRFGETGNASFLRLARTELGNNRWQRAVHERWEVPGKVGKLKNSLLHTSHTSVAGFLRKLDAYAQIEPGVRQPLSRRKVLFEMLFYPPAKFFWDVLVLSGWRDGTRGWIFAFGMAYWSLLKRVYCWEAWFTAKEMRE